MGGAYGPAVIFRPMGIPHFNTGIKTYACYGVIPSWCKAARLRSPYEVIEGEAGDPPDK